MSIKSFIKDVIQAILVFGVVLGMLGVSLIFGFEVHRSNYTLEVTNYTVTDERITDDVRMVVLADLHNMEFGKGNKKLIETVREQDPDLIVCLGDFVVDTYQSIATPATLLKGLVDVAPVYFSMGNHEVHHQMNFESNFESTFESLGVHLLEYEYEDIQVGNQELRIGGIYGYCVPERELEENRYNPKHGIFLEEFMDTESYSVLLTHIPYTWLELGGLEAWDIDLTLCGHTHGGLVRIDGVGGLYASLQGFFPGELCGEYKSEDGDRRMILTRGLATSNFIPRINNVPEVMVVDLCKED